MVAHVPLLALAERIAELRAAELELFEALGAAARDSGDPVAKPLLASCAHHLAWHAELWAQRMPALPGVDLDAITDAARAGVVSDPVAALDDIARRCDQLAREVDPVLDPATVRVCRVVAVDLAHDRQSIATRAV